MEYMPIIILVFVLIFMVKSGFDIYYSKTLLKSEKVNLAFLIVIIPVLGSIVFYVYQRHKYLVMRNKRRNKSF